MNEKLKRYWLNGLRMNIISILLLIVSVPFIYLFVSLSALIELIPGLSFIILVVGIITLFILSFPITAFLFNKWTLINQKMNTFSEHWRFGWECNFVLNIMGLFAFPIIAFSGLIYFYVSFLFPEVISLLIFLISLLILIPLIQGYYFNKWMIIEKMHQGSTKNRGFFETYGKAMLLFVGVYFFLSIYEITKEQTKISTPYFLGILLGLFILSLMGFFIYDLIEKRINKQRKIYSKNKNSKNSGIKIKIAIVMILITLAILLFSILISSSEELKDIPKEMESKCMNECDKVDGATEYLIEPESSDEELYNCFCLDGESNTLLEKKYRVYTKE